MKKNLTFKIGLFCAALVLVATCFVTNAWAKYTQTVSAVDTARVAKFAVGADIDGGALELTPATIDIFKTTHENILADSDNDEVSNVDLIAPGSNGSFVITLTNNSEVAVLYELSAEFTNDQNIPVYFSVDGTTWVLGAGTALSDILVDHTLAAGTNVEDDVTVYWAWPYDTAHATLLGITSYSERDAADTNLGLNGEYTYTVKISCVATQVQPQD